MDSRLRGNDDGFWMTLSSLDHFSDEFNGVAMIWIMLYNRSYLQLTVDVVRQSEKSYLEKSKIDEIMSKVESEVRNKP